MDFQDVEIEGGNKGCLTDTFLGILAGKPKDDVTTCQNTTLVGLADCLVGLLESVASVDELQREVVGTLNTIFYDEEGALIEFTEIVKELVGYTVRARANDNAYHIVDT